MKTYQPHSTTVKALVELRRDRCDHVCVRAQEGIDATLADYALGFEIGSDIPRKLGVSERP